VRNNTDWDVRYRRGEHIDDAPLALFEDAVSNLTPGHALDLACGPGRHAIHLALLGWQVTAVDSSPIGLEILRQHALERGLEIDIRQVDLERHEFQIQPAGYDLICDTFYLQRDLFPGIRAGLRSRGLFFAVIHVEDPAAPPMNPLFLLRRGELLETFAGWEILHYAEAAKQAGHRRQAAELICRKP
jgi:SAM-dependent methyltransferase